jgi:enamine deaminase RidA (YjgF/YER057c/UK114 family)
LDVYTRMRELGIALPPVPTAVGTYLPGKLWHDTLYVSGQTPTDGDRPILQGKVGDTISVAEAYQGARLAVLACLAKAAAVLGDLNRVEQVLRVTVYVNSAPDFDQQPAVGNGASDTLVALFGEAGRHARTSIGVAALPSGACVEVDLILGVRS